VARAWGVPRSVIVEDVRRGMRGVIDALVGAEAGGICVVSAWDCSEERGEMHKRRLQADIKSAVQP
jgi:hypothetical protein